MTINSRVVVRSTVSLLVVGFLTLLGIVAMTFWLGERAQIYFNEAIAARDIRAATVELRYALQTAESSQRGFLASGNQIYLAPYGTAKSLAQRELDKVKRFLEHQEDAQAPLQRLSILITEKFAEMDGSIALKRDRRDAEALALFRSNRGKALMDEANIFFAGIIRAAEERLTKGVGEQQANALMIRWATIIGGVVIVIVVGIVGVTVYRYTRDLTAARDEVRALNSSLDSRVKERTADLARANDEIQRYAYIVTHDLRAPLVNIMGFTSELERSLGSFSALIDGYLVNNDTNNSILREANLAASVDMPEAISFIRSSTEKMDNLINAILRLSREGKRKLRPELLDLADVINSSAASIKHQLSDSEGEMRLDLEATSLVTDKLALEQIFGNLLDNSTKYRSKLRPLLIEISSKFIDESEVELSIKDNGRGIAEQDRERIFELFRRSGVQDQSGDGIGLAQVRSVVDMLGGDIAVQSALGEGTTFRIRLPTAHKSSERLAS